MDWKRLTAAIVCSLGLHAVVLLFSVPVPPVVSSDAAADRPAISVELQPPNRDSTAIPGGAEELEAAKPITTADLPQESAHVSQTTPTSSDMPAAEPSEIGRRVSTSSAGLMSTQSSLSPAIPPTEPAPLEPIKPEYPRLARRLGLEGTVVLILTINEAGRIEDCRVEESQAHPLLVDAAVETALAGRYAPGTRGLKPVTDTLTLRIVFRLET